MNSEERQFLNDLDKRLWSAADRLRSNVNPSDYMHVVLGLVFLKYVSDAFKERRTELQAAFTDPAHDDYLGPDAGELIEQELEARDHYIEKNVFWVPALARWDFIKTYAKVDIGTKLQVKNGKVSEYEFRGIGRLLDDALPGLIDEFAKVPFNHGALKAKDILGHIYEYFLGEFYTPKSIVALIVETLQPFQGRVYDPCAAAAASLSRACASPKSTAAGSASSACTGRRPTPPPGAARQHGLAAGQRLDEQQHQLRGRNPQVQRRCGLGGMHGGTARPVVHQHADPGLHRVPHAQQTRAQRLARPQGKDALHRCPQPRLRQVRHAGGHPQARPRAHPRRYVGAAAQEDDGEAFEGKMVRLTDTLSKQFAESARLDAAIRQSLVGLGYPLKALV